jgi:hypothetical protein
MLAACTSYVIVIAMEAASRAAPVRRGGGAAAAAVKTLSCGRNALTGFRGLGDPASVRCEQLFVFSRAPSRPCALMYGATIPTAVVDTTGSSNPAERFAAKTACQARTADRRGGGSAEPPKEAGTKELPAERAGRRRGRHRAPSVAATPARRGAAAERLLVLIWYWIVFGLGMAGLLLVNWLMSWQRLEIFKMLLASFFPLAVMIIAVLGSIVFGLATPTEAAAVGAFGGLLLAGAYRYVDARQSKSGNAVVKTLVDLGGIVKESSFLTAKTSAMVCWLFVGSSIFSASFALLGGQDIIERWCCRSNDHAAIHAAQPVHHLHPQRPLEWTEIVVVFCQSSSRCCQFGVIRCSSACWWR